MRFNGKPTTDAGALTALVAADGATGGFVKDSDAIGAGHLFGMALSNGTDATNDINFAAGSCTDSTGVRRLIGSALTKQLDATWAAGTNAGGRMSAAAITDTTYHCFAILKDSDGSVDYGFDVSASAPTMPTGYTYFRRIGSIIRSSGAIRAFTQNGNEFLLAQQITDVVTTDPGTSAVLAALTVPLGIVVDALFVARVSDSTPTTVVRLYVSSPAQTDVAAAVPNVTLLSAVTTGVASSPMTNCQRRTNTSAQIRYRVDVSAATISVSIYTFGWVDTRGRLG